MLLIYMFFNESAESVRTHQDYLGLRSGRRGRRFESSYADQAFHWVS